MDLDLENSLALKGLEVHEEVEDSHEQENERNYILPWGKCNSFCNI